MSAMTFRSELTASRRITHRLAFTMVELLVVISIMVALAGVVALVAPRFGERSRVADASRQLSSWLGIAQQRAMRDKAPRGLRFVGKLPSSTYQVDDHWNTFVYVEQPEDITGVPQEIPAPAINPNQIRQQYQTVVSNQLQAAANSTIDGTLKQKYTTYANVTSPTNPNGWKYLLTLRGRNLTSAVKEGDVVEFGGARYTLVFRPIQHPTATDCIFVLHRQRDETRTTFLQSLPPYRITRSAQPIAGEPELTLPRNTAVDIQWIDSQSTNKTATRSLPAPDVRALPSSLNIDIMFGPSGEMIGPLASSGRVILWLRDVTLTDSAPDQMPEGENRLVVVHARTGQLATHAVNPDLRPNYPRLMDPYRFVRDGKSSAMEDQ